MGGNKQIIRVKLGPNLTSDLKNRAWQIIWRTLSAMGLWPVRSSSELDKKWHIFFNKLKSQILDHSRTVSETSYSSSNWSWQMLLIRPGNPAMAKSFLWLRLRLEIVWKTNQGCQLYRNGMGSSKQPFWLLS